MRLNAHLGHDRVQRGAAIAESVQERGCAGELFLPLLVLRRGRCARGARGHCGVRRTRGARGLAIAQLRNAHVSRFVCEPALTHFIFIPGFPSAGSSGRGGLRLTQLRNVHVPGFAGHGGWLRSTESPARRSVGGKLGLKSRTDVGCFKCITVVKLSRNPLKSSTPYHSPKRARARPRSPRLPRPLRSPRPLRPRVAPPPARRASARDRPREPPRQRRASSPAGPCTPPAAAPRRP